MCNIEYYELVYIGSFQEEQGEADVKCELWIRQGQDVWLQYDYKRSSIFALSLLLQKFDNDTKILRAQVFRHMNEKF